MNVNTFLTLVGIFGCLPLSIVLSVKVPPKCGKGCQTCTICKKQVPDYFCMKFCVLCGRCLYPCPTCPDYD